MDFYMPAGTVVRQETEEVKWKAREPYKKRTGKDPAKEKKAPPTHNQMTSKKYWEALEAGLSPDAALVFAVAETDKHLDEREQGATRKKENRRKSKATKSAKTREHHSTTAASLALNAYRRRPPNDARAESTGSFGGRADFADGSDEDMEGMDYCQQSGDVTPAEEAAESSDDGISSGSDNE